jgi:hypothetical protein
MVEVWSLQEEADRNVVLSYDMGPGNRGQYELNGSEQHVNDQIALLEATFEDQVVPGSYVIEESAEYTDMRSIGAAVLAAERDLRPKVHISCQPENNRVLVYGPHEEQSFSLVSKGVSMEERAAIRGRAVNNVLQRLRSGPLSSREYRQVVLKAGGASQDADTLMKWFRKLSIDDEQLVQVDRQKLPDGNSDDSLYVLNGRYVFYFV